MSEEVIKKNLVGFENDLWYRLICNMPFNDFSLQEVYSRMDVLSDHLDKIEKPDEHIRASLQRLRDKGFVDFVSRGNYRRRHVVTIKEYLEMRLENDDVLEFFKLRDNGTAEQIFSFVKEHSK